MLLSRATWNETHVGILIGKIQRWVLKTVYFGIEVIMAESVDRLDGRHAPYFYKKGWLAKFGDN